MDHDKPKGEVLFKSPAMFSGYFMEEEANKKLREQDGWMSTGDIGEILPNGALKLFDRTS